MKCLDLIVVQNLLIFLSNNKPPFAIVVFSSLEMQNNIDICKQVKQLKKHAKVPILLLEDIKITQSEYKAIGIHEFMERPFHSSRVYERLGTLVKAKQTARIDKLDMKTQLIGVVIFIIIFLVTIYFQVLVPMFFNGLK